MADYEPPGKRLRLEESSSEEEEEEGEEEEEEDTDQEEEEWGRIMFYSDEDDNYDYDEERDDSIPFWSESNTGTYREPCPFSDWKITVQSSNHDKKSRTFHVHRVMLGPKSGYFKAQFDGNRFAESSNQHTTITFPETVVKDFDVLLTYCYKQSSWGFFHADLDPHFSLRQVCILLYMSDYLDMSKLQSLCKQYLSQWFFGYEDGYPSNPSNTCYLLAGCYQVAVELQLPFVLKALLRKCALEPQVLSLKKDHKGEATDSDDDQDSDNNLSLIQVVSNEFFRNVMDQMEKRRWQKREWSNVVATFCTTRLVDYEMFHHLTNKKKLPEIDPAAALLLLRMQQQVLSEKQAASSGTHQQALTCLEKRCIEPLCLSGEFDALKASSIAQLPPRVTTAVIMKQSSLVHRSTKTFKLIVSGAGMQAVNGLYKRKSPFHFVKEDDDRIFLLQKGVPESSINSATVNGYWLIGSYYHDGSSHKAFYRSTRAVFENSDMPPMDNTSWAAVTRDHGDACPTIRISHNRSYNDH
jgi:BTB/POZ domain